jgi:hypothetical protein
MQSTLGFVLVVAAACGGISKRTVEEEPAGAGGQGAASPGGGGQQPAGARGGTGGTGASGGSNARGGSGGGVAAGGSGGSVAQGGTAGTTAPDLPDPCNIGWLDIPVTCSSDQTSILEAPTCNAMFRCYLGTACGAQCSLCLQVLKGQLAGTMSLCVHGTVDELEAACRTAPPDADAPAECAP